MPLYTAYYLSLDIKQKKPSEEGFLKQGEKNYCLYSAIISLTPSG
jgi:hypothetical protein